MADEIRNRLSGLVVAALVAALVAGSVVAPAFAARVLDHLYKFEVRLDGKQIGEHEFRVRRFGDHEEVESVARFDVRFFRIPVYSYRHRNQESWRNGCLIQLDAETDDNGERQFVAAGKQKAGGFQIDANGDERQVDLDCPMSFAYWNQNILDQKRLLNPQTGQLVDVTVSPLMHRPAAIVDDTPLAGYRITDAGDQLDISVWYDANEHTWRALESRLDNGKRLEYVPLDLGDSS